MNLPAASPAARLFAGVTDPRVERTRRHWLCDLLPVALCATLAGAEGFADVEDWARMKEGWLRTFLDLPGGIPGHDTFERVFRRLNPKELHACFLRWLEGTANATGKGRHIAIPIEIIRHSSYFFLTAERILESMPPILRTARSRRIEENPQDRKNGLRQGIAKQRHRKPPGV